VRNAAVWEGEWGGLMGKGLVVGEGREPRDGKVCMHTRVHQKKEFITYTELSLSTS